MTYSDNNQKIQTMENKHTKGEWIKQTYSNGSIAVYSEADGIDIAVIPPTKRQEEVTANANLIAAAPELLESLQAVYAALLELDNSEPAYQWWIKHHKAVKDAHATINKAIGNNY
jgi:hypothetical protein